MIPTLETERPVRLEDAEQVQKISPQWNKGHHIFRNS
jgi:hypothetical protein